MKLLQKKSKKTTRMSLSSEKQKGERIYLGKLIEFLQSDYWTMQPSTSQSWQDEWNSFYLEGNACSFGLIWTKTEEFRQRLMFQETLWIWQKMETRLVKV